MILITEPMDQVWVDWLSDYAEVDYQPDLSAFPEELAEKAQLAQALIVGGQTDVSGDLLYAGFSCVGVLSGQAHEVGLAGCAEREIEVLLPPKIDVLAAAHFTLAQAADLTGKDDSLRGRTLGLIGYGDVGQLTALLGAQRGMACLASDPEAEDFPGALEGTSEEVLTTADVIAVNVPLTDETRDMIDADVIAVMKRGAIFVSTSPSGVVDEAALQAALASGHLGGVAIWAAGAGADAFAMLSEVTARRVVARLGLD